MSDDRSSARRDRLGHPGGAARRSVLAGLAGDAKSALRRLRASPGATLAAVATLGLALAVTVVMLAVLHAAWVQPVSYPDAGALVDVLATRNGRPEMRAGITPADFAALRDGVDTFSSFGAYVPFGSFELTGDGDPALLDRFLVTADFFTALGVPPLLGRTFRPFEERPGADRVVVSSFALWQGRFGGSRDVLGRRLRLDGESYTVVGVMPPEFGARGGHPDLWAPLSFGPHRPRDRRSAYLGGIGRLRDGVSLEEARAQLDAVSRRLAEELPATNGDLRTSALPLRDVMTAGLRPILSLLLAAALLVLLVAVLNVAGLLLAQGLGRRRELVLRHLLGATRGALIRLVLVESLILAALAGLLAVAVAALGLRLLPELRGEVLHHWVELGLAGPVLVLTGVVVLVVGSALALALGRQAIAFTGIASARRPAGVPALGVVVQCAACLLLLFAAGLALRNVDRLSRIDRGYRSAGIVTAELVLPPSRYPDGRSVSELTAELTRRVAELPAIESATTSSGLPGEGWSFRPTQRGEATPPEVSLRWLMVDDRYFRTLGLRVVEGRAFGPGDRLGSTPVAIVNRAAARLLAREAGITSIVGRELSFGADESWHEVVGVVEDVRRDAVTAPVPACYLHLAQHAALVDQANLRRVRLLVRTTGERPSLAAVLSPVRSLLAALDPELPLAGAAPLDEILDRSLFRPRLGSALLATFAGFTLLVASLGLYGLLSFSVRQRHFELGIRLALGATPGGLTLAVVGRGLVLTGSGLLAGLVAWVPLRRLAASFVPGIGDGDPLTLTLAPAVLLASAVLAAWVPARRAARIDPVVSLRSK